MILFVVNSNDYELNAEVSNMEKTDLSTARRNMHSSNIKTRKRALRTLHEVKRNAKKQK